MIMLGYPLVFPIYPLRSDAVHVDPELDLLMLVGVVVAE